MREQIDRVKNWKQFLNENIRDNESQIWFHISPTENRNNILTNGLVTTNKKRYGNISKNAIYLWKFKELALWYALTESRDFNKNFDIFQINQNVNVEEDTTIGVPESYLTTDTILPQNISKIDTINVGDKRIKQFGDIDDVLNMLEL